MIRHTSILISFFFLFGSCARENPLAPKVPDSPMKPQVFIAAPGQGATITGPTVITATGGQGDSIRVVEFFVDSVSVGRDSIPPFQVVWQAWLYADGLEHVLFAIAEGFAGDTAHSAPVTVTVSVDAQVGTLTQPAANQAVLAPLVVGVVLPAEFVPVSAEFLLDDDLLAQDTLAPFELAWNPAFWADGGNHTFKVVLTDTTGQTGTVGPVRFSVPLFAGGGPIPLSPAGRTVLGDLQETFQWSAALSAVAYDIEISPLPDFSDIELMTTVTDTFHTATIPEESIYFWRVRAVNEGQRQTKWLEAEFATTPTFSLVWSEQGSQIATSVDVTADGGYVMTGVWSPGSKAVKMNKTGEEQWSLSIPSAQSASIRQTSDGGFIVAGRFESATEGRYGVMKLNSSGTQTWLKRYGRYFDEAANHAIETQDGGFVTVGYMQDLLESHNRVWLTKTGSSGDSLWGRTYHQNAVTFGKRVLETQDGGLLLLADIQTELGGQIASWVLRTDVDGDSLWSKTFSSELHESAVDIVEIAGGYTFVSHKLPDQDIVLRRIDDSGNELWVKTYSAAADLWPTALLATADGGYLITAVWSQNAENTADVYLIRTNAGGDTLWTKKFGGPLDDFVGSAGESDDGGFILVGHYELDALIMKTDKRGRIAGVVY